VRRGFIRKVLFIVTCMLAFTVGCSLVFFFVHPLKVRFPHCSYAGSLSWSGSCCTGSVSGSVVWCHVPITCPVSVCTGPSHNPCVTDSLREPFTWSCRCASKQRQMGNI
jgi:hypothetical protein